VKMAVRLPLEISRLTSAAKKAASDEPGGRLTLNRLVVSSSGSCMGSGDDQAKHPLQPKTGEGGNH
jgi:hypothetical protein